MRYFQEVHKVIACWCGRICHSIYFISEIIEECLWSMVLGVHN